MSKQEAATGRHWFDFGLPNAGRANSVPELIKQTLATLVTLTAISVIGRKGTLHYSDEDDVESATGQSLTLSIPGCQTCQTLAVINHQPNDGESTTYSRVKGTFG